MPLHLWHFVLLVPLFFGAYLLIALYVYAPLKIRKRQTKDIDPVYEPIELPQLPADVANAFESAARTLAPCGFAARGHLRCRVFNTGQDSYVSIWVNPSTSDSAQIIGVRTPSPLTGGVKIVCLVTFRSEYEDGTSIVTTNSPSSGCFPRDRRVSGVRCPGVWDLALLYRFHRARVERERGSRSVTLERVQDPISRMRFEYEDTYQRLIQAGYYSLDAARRCYVPTFKGAYLMAYRLLPPFKQIRKLRMDADADRALRAAGFGGLSAFGGMQSPGASGRVG
jgi:hypothetical protein